VTLVRATLLFALLSGAACAPPPPRPKVVYEPIEGIAEVIGTGDAADGGAAAQATEAAATEAPEESDPPEAKRSSRGQSKPKDEKMCFKKLGGGCCGDVGVPASRSKKKPSCPRGWVPEASCKGKGRGCRK
jgi:hypothetical protein